MAPHGVALLPGGRIAVVASDDSVTPPPVRLSDGSFWRALPQVARAPSGRGADTDREGDPPGGRELKL